MTMTAPLPVVSLRAVSKVYGTAAPVTALDAVSLEICRGERVLIMGPSGSGKTTLLSVMGCMLRPSSGQVHICSRDVTNLTESQLPAVRLHAIGFIFQAFNLLSALTARENIEIALELKGAARPAARRQALELLDSVGLADHAAHLPAELSGGQKQRVAIARALATDAPLILADEPTAALDSSSGNAIMEILSGLARTHDRAVVIVTHDPRLKKFADRVLMMDDGRLLRDSGEPALELAEVQCS
jgi:putative ABC transport system ATP-binding protein